MKNKHDKKGSSASGESGEEQHRERSLPPQSSDSQDQRGEESETLSQNAEGKVPFPHQDDESPIHMDEQHQNEAKSPDSQPQSTKLSGSAHSLDAASR